jgi:hypothetical protein
MNLTVSDPQKNYLKFKESFLKMTDEQLIDISKKEKNNSGWTSSRAFFLSALSAEIEKRNIKRKA